MNIRTKALKTAMSFSIVLTLLCGAFSLNSSAGIPSGHLILSGIIVSATGNSPEQAFLQYLSYNTDYTASASGVIDGITGAQLSSSEAVGTNDYITLTYKPYNITSTYRIIVKGDVNGDSAINSSDLDALALHLKGTTPLTGNFLKAADYNWSASGVPDNTDYDQMFYTVYGVIRGDVTSDAKVSSADLDRLLLHLKGTSLLTGISFKSADFDYSGILNSADYTAMHRLVYGNTAYTKTYVGGTDYIKNIRPRTTVDHYKTQSGLRVAAVYDPSVSTKLGANDFVYTGCFSDEYSVYHYIIVNGDVNGDGLVTTTDVTAIRNHISGEATLYGAYAMAADCNGDGQVSVSDIVQANAWAGL